MESEFNPVADSGEGAEKNFFVIPPASYLRVWMTESPFPPPPPSPYLKVWIRHCNRTYKNFIESLKGIPANFF